MGKQRGRNNKETPVVSKMKDLNIEEQQNINEDAPTEEIKEEEGDCNIPNYLSAIDYVSFPCIKQIIEKNEDSAALTVDNLSQLTSELEQCLTSVVLRVRMLKQLINNDVEFTSLAQPVVAQSNQYLVVDDEDDQETDPLPTPVQPKRKRASESGRVSKSMKDLSKIKEINKVYLTQDDLLSDNATDGVDMENPQSSSYANMNKFQASNRFWSSVETYCSDITPETIKDLELLLEEAKRDGEERQIPPLGVHYSKMWSEEDLNQEKAASVNNDSNGEKIESVSSSVEENSLPSTSAGAVLEKAANALGVKGKIMGPLASRLVSALVEKGPRSFNDPILKFTIDDDYFSKLPSYHTSACFEQRVSRELDLCGVLKNSDDEDSDGKDEILEELKNCQKELRIVARQNREFLQPILERAKLELKRQEIRDKMKNLDKDILDGYRRHQMAKINRKPLQKKEKEQIWKLIKDREVLVKELVDLG